MSVCFIEKTLPFLTRRSVLFTCGYMPADDQLGLCLLCDVAQLTVALGIVVWRKTIDWRTVLIASVFCVTGCVAGLLVRQTVAHSSSQIVLFCFAGAMLLLAIFVAVLAAFGTRARLDLSAQAGAQSPVPQSTLSWESVEDVPEEPLSNRSSLSLPRSPVGMGMSGPLSERSSLMRSGSGPFSDSFERLHQHGGGGGGAHSPNPKAQQPSISDVFLEPRPPPRSVTRLEELHDRIVIGRDGTKFRFRIGSPLEAVFITLLGGFGTGAIGTGIGLSMVAVLVARCRVPFPVAVATALTTSLFTVVVASTAWLIMDKNSIASLGEAAWATPGALLGGAVGVWLSPRVATKYLPAVLAAVYIGVGTAALLSALLTF